MSKRPTHHEGGALPAAVVAELAALTDAAQLPAALLAAVGEPELHLGRTEAPDPITRLLTALDGRYVYGDFCGGDIHSFTVPAPGQGAGDDAATGLHVDGLDSFGVDGLGHVYAVSLNGPVYRLDSPG